MELARTALDRAKAEGRPHIPWGELVDRMGQLDLLLDMIAERQATADERGQRSLELMHRFLDRGVTWENASLDDRRVMASDGAVTVRLVKEIALLTEAFYLFAGRIRNVVRAVGLGDPRLRPKAWRVRDDLIEHYEAAADATHAGSFGFGTGRSPGFTKPAARGTTSSGDLVENARELAAVLERILAADSRPGPPSI